MASVKLSPAIKSIKRSLATKEAREDFLTHGNAYTMSIRKRKIDEIMLAAARMSEQDKERAPELVSDKLLEGFSKIAVKTVKGHGIRLSLAIGCIVFLFLLATANTRRRGMRKAFFRSLGRSSAQCYRDKDLFVCYGQPLLENPRLMDAISAVEVLKLTSALNVPELVRVDVLQMASEGKEVNTHIAKELIRKYQPQDQLHFSSEAENSPLKPRTSWQFAGQAVRIRVSRKSKTPFPSDEALADELRAAISSLVNKETPSDSGASNNVS
jgi:hypothetical protein